MLTKYKYFLKNTKILRNIVRWADRNHLTGRTREDVFYGTNTTIYHEETVLKCLNPYTRLPVRPKNFFRKQAFDIEQSVRPVILPDPPKENKPKDNKDEEDKQPVEEKPYPERILINSNLQIRHEFRHFKDTDLLKQIKSACAAPANNHATAAVTRNAASQTLTDFKTKYPNITLFSLSGAKIEQKLADGGFRGAFQPSDMAQEFLADVMLQPPPEMNRYADKTCVAVATDTLNHLSEKEKNALLGNGINLLSYNPTAQINNYIVPDTRNERISFWKDKLLQTRVNGGGDYVDELWDTNYDIMVAECPDGDIMMVYVESFLDKADQTHSYLAEIPFCKIHRRTELYYKMNKYPHIRRLAPLNFKVTDSLGAENNYSMFNIKHSDLVQITNNDTRQTTYFRRSELMAIAPLNKGHKVFSKLGEVTINNSAPLDNNVRQEFAENMGLPNAVRFLQAPEINFSTPLTTENISKRIVASILAGDPRAAQLEKELMPDEVRKQVTSSLEQWTGDLSLKPILTSAWDWITKYGNIEDNADSVTTNGEQG